MGAPKWLGASSGWRPDDQVGRLFSDGRHSFITPDQVVKEYIGRVRELFADLELVLLDADDVPAGWAVPLCWDGDPAHLPGGYSDSLVRAGQGHSEGQCGMGINQRPISR